jgi:hypothetical protein
MTVKIQLPSDKKEATFVMDLLKRLNLMFETEENNYDSNELNMLLKERIADMEANPNDVISWDEIQKRDKPQKATL